jgi:hypothetical protein
MDRIIARFDDTHRQVEKLLPWFVTGQLGDADRALVADHVTTCELCRAELHAEQALNQKVARMPIDVDLGWAALRRRVESGQARARAWPGARRLVLHMVDRPRAAALLIAAQVALLVAAVAILPPVPRPAPYHALSAATAPARGNVIVMFRADAKAAEVSALLAQSGARIVDGPTSTGAFVLTVPAARRPAALASLRAQPVLTMAEPLDP